MVLMHKYARKEKAMGFADAVKTCFSKYVDFNGRARRSEYWYWTLFVFLVSFAASLVGNALNAPVFAGIISLALMLPSLGVAVRRLHDIGKSGWFVLLSLIPLVGLIILIVWCVKDSEVGENAYGPCPK